MRKMTRLGILTTAGAGAAALAIAGFALPASADDGWDETHESTSTQTDFMSSIDGVTAWLTDALDVSGNDTAVGNVDGSLIDASVVEGPLVSDSPILSGNDTPVGSGNEVDAPVGSGNEVSAPIDAPVGSGNEVSDNEVGSGNATGSGNETDTDTGLSVGDIGADVDDVVGDVSGDVDSLVGGLLD